MTGHGGKIGQSRAGDGIAARGYLCSCNAAFVHTSSLRK